MAGIMYESYYGISGLNEMYIAHSGIKGQKWGVRRYQNEDGSLTELGKERYKVKSLKKERSELKKERRAEKAKIKASKYAIARHGPLNNKRDVALSDLDKSKSRYKEAKLSKNKEHMASEKSYQKPLKAELKQLEAQCKAHKLIIKASKANIHSLDMKLKDTGKQIYESKLRMKSLKMAMDEYDD